MRDEVVGERNVDAALGRRGGDRSGEMMLGRLLDRSSEAQQRSGLTSRLNFSGNCNSQSRIRQIERLPRHELNLTPIRFDHARERAHAAR
jgi:hypothetical protein